MKDFFHACPQCITPMTQEGGRNNYKCKFCNRQFKIVEIKK